MSELIFFTIGFLLGFILMKKYMSKKSIGTLRIDHSDPDSKPYLFLEIDNGKAHELQNSKEVSFHVDFSQK